VARVVERLGGEVGVKNRSGQGSTFFFALLMVYGSRRTGSGNNEQFRLIETGSGEKQYTL
jgi:hypothetical protein